MEKQVSETDVLRQQGFRKIGVYDEPRLSEVVAMYAEIGFEVRIAKADLENGNQCTTCIEAAPDRYKTVYTRPKDTTL